MSRIRLSRWTVAASAAAIVAVMPLTLAGCGGSDGGAAASTPPKNFTETHKDSMEFYKQQHQQNANKGAHR